MTRQIFYNYLGDNGSLLTPIHIPGAYYIQKIRLVADEDKALTKDGKNFVSSIFVTPEEESLWQEVYHSN